MMPCNRYNMTVQITLDSTGETVYQSKGIRPGQYIQYIRLSEDLPADITSEFQFVETDDGDYVLRAKTRRLGTYILSLIHI